MALAARRADEDAGGDLLTQVDRLDVVNLVSWRYADPPAALATRLGIAPRSAELRARSGARRRPSWSTKPRWRSRGERRGSR